MQRRPSREPSPGRHWLEPVCGWLALAIPLLVTIARASPSTQWRDDLPVVRSLGFIPIGGEGVLSSVLTQVLALMPVGGRLLRASVASAIGLALAARLAYALGRRVLDANALTPRLGPVLALVAALTATLAPAWQLEGTIAGGATLGAALALAGLALRPRADVRDARVWLAYGALVAATVLENHAAGLALAVALGVQVAVLGELPPRRSVALFGVGLGAVAAVLLAPVLLRPLSDHDWVGLGYGLARAPASASPAPRPDALAAWLADVGVVAVGLAVAGSVWGLARPRTRWLALPLAALVVADVLFPAGAGGLLAADPRASLRLLAIIVLAVSGALGVQTLVLGLSRARIPMARPAAVLLVLFQLTLLLMTAEDASYVADRGAQFGAEVWTEEALGDLPPRAALLVRSPAVVWRLWAARLVRGERPDVVIAPLPLMDRPGVTRALIAAEPELAALVRDMTINGRPSELGLSTLADARPLFVELDPSWSRRLVDHLSPRPLWLGFAPHALGRSDREPALERGQRAFDRALAAAASPAYRDRATLWILAERAREQAVVLAALGDYEAVQRMLVDLRKIDPSDPFAQELEARLARRARGRVDVEGLLSLR